MFKFVSATLALVAGALSIDAHAHGRPGGHNGDDPSVITQWNAIAEANIPASASVVLPRTLAIMHVAMFDAVNSIEGGYTPYRVQLPALRHASSEAAAAQAAHDVMVALQPAEAAAYDAALAERLADIQPLRAQLGAQVGREAAKRVLQWRATDGWNLPQTYTPAPMPGVWRPAPPAFAAAAFVQSVDAQPFGLPRPYYFMPRRPPELDSQEYADAVNEIKAIGGVDSAVRTAEQTLQARLWASINYKTLWSGVWQQVTRNLATQRKLSLIQSARLFALMNTTMQDAVQTSMASKFAYSMWRPVHAIQLADQDMNPSTDPDTSWMPLLPTPPYPAYAGNMACIGAAEARALQLFFGTNDIPVSVTWEGINGNANVTRNFAGFEQLSEHQAISREYGGIHYHFDTTASWEVCPKVAGYIYGNYMRPQRH
ncbi:MAG TPA: vanadium-dependent haloperoxidase [Steroidobacteraceae bacterium]|jgi:hypothetical protein